MLNLNQETPKILKGCRRNCFVTSTALLSRKETQIYEDQNTALKQGWLDTIIARRWCASSARTLQSEKFFWEVDDKTKETRP
jgi:hypothetical protein